MELGESTGQPSRCYLNLQTVLGGWIQRFLSHRVFADYDDILQACAEAWRALTRDTLKSLTAFPWIARISS